MTKRTIGLLESDITPASGMTKNIIPAPVSSPAKSDVKMKPVSTSKPSLNESESKSALTEFLKRGSMLQYGRNISPTVVQKEFSRNVLPKFSDSQKDSIVTTFGVPNFSSTFNDQFLQCTGRELGRRPVNVTNEGNVVMPKHFQKCKSMNFQKTGNTVALLSFPGSGNSWVRQLIETTTGIYTGTYKDCDESYIISGGMIGEGIDTDNVIAVKIHAINGAPHWLYPHNIIYIIRNPFDAILAEWNRISSSRKVHFTAHVSTTADFGTKWIQAVLKYSKRWGDHVTRYLGSTKTPLIVVKYENLLSDLHTELKRMMEFMKFPYTEDDLQCTIKSTVEGFRRKHDKSIDPYTPEQRKLVQTQINLANEVLRCYNISY
ncbi:WSCD family member GA21586-like isoform X2 [Dysidea avara]